MLRSILKQLLGRARAGRGARDTLWLEHAGALHDGARHAEAAAVCRERLEAHPADVDALQMLAAALLAQGLTGEGIACLRQGLAHAPERAELHATLAQVCAASGALDEAVEAYTRAVAMRADAADWWLGLVALLKVIQRYDEAEDRCREAIAAHGESPALRHALAGTLFEQGRVEEAIVELRASLALDADAPGVHSDLLRALNYSDRQAPAAVFSEHRLWGGHHARALQDARPDLDPRAADRRLRVGYVSPYFRKHAVTFFLESVLEHHNPTAVEVLLYADVVRPDAYSERLKSYGARWRSTVGMTDPAMAGMVRADGVDILVDLSGHTPGNRLLVFARRAAPVQVTWNGYPNTTGMSAMDYRITDALCDPPGLTEHLHTEKLVRLPNIYMSWRPPDSAPEPGFVPAHDSGVVTFGSFNSCFKISARTIELWSRVLHAVPGSRLRLLTVSGARAAARLREGFAAHGVGTQRLEFAPRTSHEEFLAAHRSIDIALDAFPYHGTTTTCFSLWMGVPVVTLTGAAHVSRVGLSLLTSIGLPELAAPHDDDYVACAAGLAGDLERLGALRAGLRERMLGSALTDGRACATALEHAYRSMWQDRCSEVT